MSHHGAASWELTGPRLIPSAGLLPRAARAERHADVRAAVASVGGHVPHHPPLDVPAAGDAALPAAGLRLGAGVRCALAYRRLADDARPQDRPAGAHVVQAGERPRHATLVGI